MLFNTISDTVYSNFKQVNKNEYDPRILEKLKKISVNSSLSGKNEKSRNNVRKVNFIRFLKKPKNMSEIELGIKGGILNGFFKNSDYFNNIDKSKIEDEKILIDNEVFRKSQTDKIAKKILVKCNFNHIKNPNNNTSLKAGEGKMMITNGLTINEFYHKYKF